MRAPLSDQDVASLVAEMVDRQAISDLLISYARFVDTKQWDDFAAMFVEDCVLEYPWEGEWSHHEGRAHLAEKMTRSFQRYVATEHISTNHQITVNGDSASSTSYLWSAHIRSADQEDHWDVGGYYFCEFVRTSEGWRYSRLRLDVVWQTNGIADILGADEPR